MFRGVPVFRECSCVSEVFVCFGGVPVFGDVPVFQECSCVWEVFLCFGGDPVFRG